MRPLVLLHGWGLHAGVWDEVLPAFSGAWQVHAPDLPGHGHAPHGPASFTETVDTLARSLPEASIVCGWSLGGLLAQDLAARHPRSVARLLLVGTSPCFLRRPGWEAAMGDDTLAQFATDLHHDRDATLASFVRLNALHGARGREAIRAFTRKLSERPAPSLATLSTTLEWLRQVDLRPRAAQIAAETVVLHGARDLLAPVAAGRWLAATIPGARLVEIADAAHMPFFSHADDFVRTVISLA